MVLNFGRFYHGLNILISVVFHTKNGKWLLTASIEQKHYIMLVTECVGLSFAFQTYLIVVCGM